MKSIINNNNSLDCFLTLLGAYFLAYVTSSMTCDWDSFMPLFLLSFDMILYLFMAKNTLVRIQLSIVVLYSVDLYTAVDSPA